jgi:hypothetical protein
MGSRLSGQYAQRLALGVQIERRKALPGRGDLPGHLNQIQIGADAITREHAQQSDVTSAALFAQQAFAVATD